MHPGVLGQYRDAAGSGPHLAPEEFHRVIEEAADPALARPGEEVVLVDVRNVYETEIGRFRYQDKSGRVIEAINPGTRKVGSDQ